MATNFSIDTKLLLNISLPKDDTLIIIGKIVWVKKISNKTYMYGIQFWDINNEQLIKMKKLFINDEKLF